VLLNVGGLIGAWACPRLASDTSPTVRSVSLSRCVTDRSVGFALHGSAYVVAVIVFCTGFLVIGAQTNIPLGGVDLSLVRALRCRLQWRAGESGPSRALSSVGICSPAYELGGVVSVAAVPTLLAGLALLMLSVSDK